jgi:hypothetical protein
MKRKELEQKITDAADGLLTASEIRLLEEKLKHYPDLQQNYRDIMNLPDLSAAYTSGPYKFRNDLHIHRIRKLIQSEDKHLNTLGEITIKWFRKYALAAVVLIFGLTTISHIFLQQYSDRPDELPVTELIYAYEESSAEEYVTYLDEIIIEP